MANQLFPAGKELLLTGGLDWLTDDVRVALLRGYAFNVAHTSLADLVTAGAELVAQSGAMILKTAAGGVADADDVTLVSVAAGAACSSIVIYKEGASNATRVPIAYFDTGIGLPVTPVGDNVNLVWDQGSNRIFRL